MTDITISVTHHPSISGYGGFDGWELENLTDEQSQELIQQLDNIVALLGRKWKKEEDCYWCGAR